MKKGNLINSEISSVVAKMGHTDMLVIADSGLPIPDEVQRIDLALTKNVPAMLDTLKVILTELEVEEVIIAKEMPDKSPRIYNAIKEILKNVSITMVAHEEFKDITKNAKAIIRTGEFTPYANIILKSGVTF
ncbi:MAG: D-ribose pyranase [Clostridiales bacterium]|jgi:D-ribose pyranase|nr:D-ribose pyranase [Clostridiales bacterium]MDK2933748.1 D-ribose pyranase [Clostridiales bacterium]